MKELTLIEIAVENAVVAITENRVFVIGATSSSLILYASSLGSGRWVATGHRRPFEPEASISDVIARAYAWVSELEDPPAMAVDFVIDGPHTGGVLEFVTHTPRRSP